MADTTTTPTTVMRYAGKLIALSDDGRIVDFQALVEIDGEHSTLSGLSAEEAAKLRPYLGQRVAVTVSALGSGEDEARARAAAAEPELVDASDDPAAMSAALLELARELGCDCNLDDMLHAIDKLQRDAEDVDGLRDQLEQVRARGVDALRTLWLVVRVAGAPNGVTIPRREVMVVDWSRCALRREEVLGTGDIHLEAVDTERGQGIPPSAAAHANAGMAAVADALGLDDDADLATVLQGIDSLKARAARVIDRNLEVTITTALGCDDTAAAIVQAIQALKHQAGQGGPSVHQRMHQQLLDMLGAGDHQAAAARIGELVGLELLLHAGGAGKGVTAIAQERRGQIEREGYNPDDDLRYCQGELARAADCYVRLEAMRSLAETVPGTSVDDRVPPEWPWDAEWWKPKGRRDNLVRAGALIAAELDRMDRAAAQPVYQGDPDDHEAVRNFLDAGGRTDA